jgi:hypothetical protein
VIIGWTVMLGSLNWLCCVDYGLMKKLVGDIILWSLVTIEPVSVVLMILWA